MVRRFLVSALSVLAFAQVHASTQSTPTSPLFPLLGRYLISAPHNYGEPTYAASIAKLNVAILSVWPGFSSNGMTMQQTVQSIKKINPNTIILMYQNINELEPNGSAATVPLINAIDSNHWWLYNSGSSGSMVPSWWGKGYYEVNTTLVYPPNSTNQRYVDWRAAYNAQQFGPSTIPAADGLFTDNVFWSPRVNGDWAQNGTLDSDSNPTVQQWYRLGYVRYLTELKSALPGKYVTGNIADWGSSNAVITEYNQVMQGGLMESIIGQSYSYESQGFSVMMTAYKKMMNAIAAPQLVMFAQDDVPTDYQGMRYGLAACLLGNAYYDFNANGTGNSVPWFDEFDANLGTATSQPFPSAPYQNGVYRRDFQNGISLVNPKGNGKQTVTLETSYRKLSGTQDPAVNNGQTVTSVTLNDRDGVILMRLNAQAVPAAPSLTVE